MTTLYSFCAKTNCTDGEYPLTSLIQATDGNFYGTTSTGGAYTCPDGHCGTIFSITPKGFLSTLHSFDSTDGGYAGGLLQATTGVFYGTTPTGGFFKGGCGNTGFDGCGTVFSLDVGLGPFISFSAHSYGKAGQTAGILGQGLTGTTSLSFNGTPASFTIVSGAFIKATVPPGATTGYVTVTTPSGTLTSNVPFHVIR